MTKTLALHFLLTACFYTSAQSTYRQYFDGADTSAFNSLFPILDTTSTWQIGNPSKQRFMRAFTQPKAILTDSVNPYPINDTSSFEIPIPLDFWPNGILALEWVQSLDLEDSIDFGFVEFRKSDTSAWENVFFNNYVYNVFGFDSTNLQQHNGRWGFTGLSDRDNVWICLDLSYFQQFTTNDTMYFRFQMISDSADSQQDGWMLDNFFAHITGFHTINENDSKGFLNVSPIPTNNVLNIDARKTGAVQYIESIELVDLNGTVLKKWGKSPTKFSIEVGDQPAGIYILRIHSNIMKEEFRILIQP